MKLRKNRWRNKGLWVSVAALVLMVLQDFGVGITLDHYQQYVSTVLAIAIMAGVINDPNEGEWYEDER